MLKTRVAAPSHRLTQISPISEAKRRTSGKEVKEQYLCFHKQFLSFEELMLFTGCTNRQKKDYDKSFYEYVCASVFFVYF